MNSFFFYSPPGEYLYKLINELLQMFSPEMLLTFAHLVRDLEKNLVQVPVEKVTCSPGITSDFSLSF